MGFHANFFNTKIRSRKRTVIQKKRPIEKSSINFSIKDKLLFF